MKLKPKDLRQLYLSGGLALILLALGAGVVWRAKAETRAAGEALKQAERRAGDIRNRLRQVNIEEQEIRTKSSFYRQLEQRRMVGPEQRLDWIELIDGIREQRNLFEIDYEISPPKQDGAAIGEFSLNASEMSFHLPLLHEGDLLTFLNDLQQRAPALVQVRQCEIVRLTGRPDRQSGDPNLDARCRLRWSTIGLQAKAGGKP
jgi:hypothetical protein